MALCSWCLQEMMTATSCAVEALHRDGVWIVMIPHGKMRGNVATGSLCSDCGVVPGGWHHPGCDMQRCPLCRRQMTRCGHRFDEDGPDDGLDDDDFFHDDDDVDDDGALDDEVSPFGVDGNGQPTERRINDGTEVIVHYADVPESDLTTIHGIRCTNALRTMIDVACEMPPGDLVISMRDCLQRRLFTVDDANRRLDAPDMADYRGAHLVRAALPLASGSGTHAE